MNSDSSEYLQTIYICSPTIDNAFHAMFHPLEAFRKWKRRPRPPLPPQRKRCLTIPLPDEARRGFRKQRTCDQSQSSFLSRLPLEVRLKIYEYVLAAPGILHVVHVAQSGHLRSVRCDEPGTKRSMTHACSLPDFVSDHVGYLNILYTCRQM